MELTTTQQQRQLLSQQMIPSAGILQMTAQELTTYLQEMALENPVMEIHESSASRENPDFTSCLHQRSVEEYQWLSASDESNRYFYEQQAQDGENPITWKFRKTNQPQTLADALWEQLVSIPFRSKDAKTLKYMLASLDSWGYLREPLDQIGKKFDQPEDRMELLLSVLQALDPPGVGARSISECLLLQLKRQTECPSQLEFIITECLDLLAKNQIPAIAKKAGVSVKEASRLCQIIRSLNPKPGAAYSNEDISRYIQPDILIKQKHGECTVTLNDSLYPQLSINQYYRQLSKTAEEDVRKYLLEKIRQVDWIRTCIAQRNDTLFRTASAIAEHQKDFFLQGSRVLKPLRLSDIADSLGLHESTVSRAVRNKYLQCSHGIFPLNYFFSGSLSSPKDSVSSSGKEAVSAEAAKTALRRLIEQEDKEKPWSDRILSEKLEALGVPISRRTVAKYRESLGIPDASKRKSYS